MRIVRAAIANMEAPGLTIPQFRTLLFLQGHVGTSLSITAEFLGLTLPSTSKLVDQLVRRGLVDRFDAEEDRRRMNLRITSAGDALLKSAQERVRERLAGMLDRFKPAEVASLKDTLELLQDGLTLLAEDGLACGNHVGPHRASAVKPDKTNGIKHPMKAGESRLAAIPSTRNLRQSSL